MVDPGGRANPIPRVLEANRRILDVRWWRLRMCNSYWRIYLNETSGAEVIHPGGIHRLTPQRIHLLPAWGDFESRALCPVEHYFIHIDPGEPLRDVARWPHPVAAHFRRPITLPRNPTLEAGLRAVASSASRSPLWYLQAQALALTTIVACLDLMPAADRARLEDMHDSDDPISDVQRYIEDHLHRELAVGDLAERCQLSVSHFYRLFRQRTGVTPQRFVQDRRVAMASERLLTSGDSIDVIAEKCGFANRSHFSRVFALRRGLGPATYRREVRSESPADPAIR